MCRISYIHYFCIRWWRTQTRMKMRELTFGWFPLSGTGRYSTVWFRTEHPDPACVSTERYGSVQYGMIRDRTPWSSLRFHWAVRVGTVRYDSGQNTLIQLAFPLSGTGQYSTVWFGTEHPDPACVSTERYGSVQYGMIRDRTPWSSLRFHWAVRVGTVRYDSGQNTLIQLAFPTVRYDSGQNTLIQLAFPLSGTGQYSTVWFGTEHPDPACVFTANSTFTWLTWCMPEVRQ